MMTLLRSVPRGACPRVLAAAGTSTGTSRSVGAGCSLLLRRCCRLPTPSPPVLLAPLPHHYQYNYFSAAAVELQPQETTTAAAQPPPVPITWTTHRLSSDQILKVDKLFHKILWLDMIETAILVEQINDRLGKTLSPKQRAALERQMDLRRDGGGGSSVATAAKEEEDEGPKLVDLKLTGFDAASKIKVIKEVRSIAGLGLKEAKELVEGAPKVIQKGLKPEQAEELKQKLEAAGAQVELT